jgi:hypothetical protein
MRKHVFKTVTSVCALAILAGCSSGQQQVSYKANVKPIIDKHCAECHLPGGTGAEKTGFLVDSYDNFMKGTKFGPVVVAGDAPSSSLYRLVSGKVHKSIRMPHSKEPMSEQEISAIENWINQGALNN